MLFLTNLNAADCFQTTTNGRLIYFLLIHANCKKTSVQYENSVFEIRAVRENKCLIARCPFTFICVFSFVSEPTPSSRRMCKVFVPVYRK